MTQRTRPVALDDDVIARQQFNHYVGQVDPTLVADWTTLRRQLAVALEAAGSGISVFTDRPLGSELLRIAARRQQLAELIDAVRRRHQDAEWNEFRTELYQAWRGLDTDGAGRKRP